MSDQVVQNESENKSVNGALRSLVFILVAGFPFAVYIIGNSYHETYLAAYGIDSQGFPLSIQGIYIKAYESITLNFFDASLNITKGLEFIFTFEFIYLFVVVSILFLPWVISVTSLNKPSVTNETENKKQSKPADKVYRILGILFMPPLLSAGVFAGVFAICLALFLGLISLYMAGSKQAEKRADEVITAFRDNNGCFYKDASEMWSNCTQLIASDGKTVLQEGILVVQTDKRVAFYNGKHSVILEIPEGASIRNVVNAELLKET